MPIMYSYIGAQPGGRSAPDLYTVPVPPNGDPDWGFVFVLAFANPDANGNIQPQWNPSITPDIIADIKSRNENVSFHASLGGDGIADPMAYWNAPADQQSWINNATQSLLSLIDLYHLDGLNVDFENGIVDQNGNAVSSFLTCMGAALSAVWLQFLVVEPGGGWYNPFDVSYSPFGYTAGVYSTLYHTELSTNVAILYQPYADGSTLDDYQAIYTNLDNLYTSSIPLGLGIASATGDNARGLQPPDIFAFWNQMPSLTMDPSVAIWCAEDSADNNYSLETQLIPNAAPLSGASVVSASAGRRLERNRRRRSAACSPQLLRKLRRP